MTGDRRIYVRFLAVLVVVGGLGLAASIYTLVNQRASLPFGDSYEVKAEFAAADGVAAGLGQPVNVVGVKVGQVTGKRLERGRALVTMRIDRDKLPRLHADARAVLEPITPLEDMQITLHPGTRAAGPLPDGRTLAIERTSSPAQLADVMAVLDADTREFLSGLIGAVGEGTRGRGSDIRRILNALGPTTAAAGRVSRALADRRRALARLVKNVAGVTRAASSNGQLASAVTAGNRTLSALAAEQKPLRDAIAQFPPTLAVARNTLTNLQPFARRLGPALDALAPAVDRLPATLSALRPFARTGERVLRRRFRPLVATAQPFARQLQPIVPTLSEATPQLSRSFQALEYFVNELAYNPDRGNNQGFLFWTSWAAHNINSVMSTADANGGVGRAVILSTCMGIGQLPVLESLVAPVGACPP